MITISVLAVIDLMVGVSNDAVNFLNSALGSKALPFKTIMIVASLGIIFGSVFSSGMMEIARSGIFVPAKFTFNDVMILFLTVMITDVILLDIFNYFGLPTSTTVSIVFELLGAAVALAIYKIISNSDSITTLASYINTEKASEIVISILLSVIISFTLGMIIQYVSRLIFSFQFEKKIKTFGPFFGGVALAAISYFILIKGLKDVSFLSPEVKNFLATKDLLLVVCSFIFFTIFCFVLNAFKVNIFKIIIAVGTFGLALSFAGNDLVNFIGVPVAALQSITIFKGSGISPDEFMMSPLASADLVAPVWILLCAGLIMVLTLWTSKKSRTVIETEMSLSNQDSGSDKFKSTILSRGIVRTFVYLGNGLSYIVPRNVQTRLDKQFENLPSTAKNSDDKPMFDMVRASVNLMVASSLIALGTSMKLPLSTTYVTFMVAMGSAFADRAWDRESAVYRVAGVLHVIGGWFVTAAFAFTGAFVLAYLLKIGGIISFVGAIILLTILLYRNAKSHDKKEKERASQKLKLEKRDIQTIQQVTEESANQISDVISRTNILYQEIIEGLISQDLMSLNSNKKLVKKLQKDLNSTNSALYNFIRNLDDSSAKGSRYYIMSLGYLQDIVENLAVICSNVQDHVSNNHKPLKINQAKDLKYAAEKLSNWHSKVYTMYKRLDFGKVDDIIEERGDLQNSINEFLDKQIHRIRTSENSPKNSKLYFSILLETNELINSTFKLLRLHKEFANFRRENIGE